MRRVERLIKCRVALRRLRKTAQRALGHVRGKSTTTRARGAACQDCARCIHWLALRHARRTSSVLIGTVIIGSRRPRQNNDDKVGTPIRAAFVSCDGGRSGTCRRGPCRVSSLLDSRPGAGAGARSYCVGGPRGWATEDPRALARPLPLLRGPGYSA